MKNKKGFTLVEILAVIILLIIITLIGIFAINKYTERSKLTAFVKEANTFAKAAENKFLNDKNLDVSLRSDLYNGTKPGRVCYSIYDDLLDTYVVKDKKYKYTGSIELCYGDDCTYQYKLWLTDGKKDYINGKTKFDNINTVEFHSDIEYFDSCEFETIGSHIGSPSVAEFDYLGTEQRMTILKDGNYRLEVWGAQGGDQAGKAGGVGAYAVNEVTLKKGDKLYINVGGKGRSDCTDHCKGGYNGGGSAATNWSSGGGATTISTESGTIDQLKNINKLLILAAGGGGVSKSSEQTYKHGLGYCSGNHCRYYSTIGAKNNSSCGGGYSGCTSDYAGGGGTSYIANKITSKGETYCYTCPQDTTEYNVSYQVKSSSKTPKEKTSKVGNGYARITYASDYKLSYDLSGGVLAVANPLNYSHDDETITLNNPTKNYYNFEGWSVDIENLFSSSSIYKDKTYITNDGTETSHNDYTIYQFSVTPNTKYIISHSNGPTDPGFAIYNDAGQVISGEKYLNRSNVIFTTPSNASYIRYSVVSGKSNSSYDKYIFKLYKISTNQTIPSGSSGNRKFKAYYTPINYSVSYDLNGGSLAEGVTNTTTFNIESSAFTLNNPSRSGYRFAGWTGSNGETPQTSVTVASGSTGNKNYLANYNQLYQITLDYNLPEHTFSSAELFMNTGFIFDYTYDLGIDMIVNIPTSGKRYLLIGNYDTGANFNIEVNTSNKFRVYQTQDRATTGAIPLNEDLSFEFDYTGSNKAFTFAYTSETSSDTKSGTLLSSGFTGAALRLNRDYRGGITFTPYTVKKLVISHIIATSQLPTTVTLPGYEFNGWYTSQTGGTLVTASNMPSYANQTLYAHWTQTE